MAPTLIRLGIALLLTAPAVAATRSDLGNDAATFDRQANTPGIDLSLPQAPERSRGLPDSAAPIDLGKQNRAPQGSARGNPLWATPLSTLSATRERPVFSASRRPPPRAVAVVPVVESAPPPPPPPPPEMPRLALVGAVGNGAQSIALFVDQTSSAIISLKIGDNHGGWVLRTVRGRETVLEKDDRTLLLNLPQPWDQPPTTMPAQMQMPMTGGVPGLEASRSIKQPPAVLPVVQPIPAGRVPGL
jgi:general secretion pathway protein N